MASSPGSKRIVSLSSSPRGNTHGRNHHSGTDLLCVAFLRYTKWILLGFVIVAAYRLSIMAPIIPLDTMGEHSMPTPTKPSSVRDEMRMPGPPKPLLSPSNDVDQVSSSASATAASNRHSQSDDTKQTTTTKAKAKAKGTKTAAATNASTTTAAPEEDDLSRYKASNAPVILDGWDQTVQIHLVVDVTAGSTTNNDENTIDPASKLILSGVERSRHLQLKALTFVKPSMKIETLEMAERDPSLPLVVLVDWGSMNRDCHRLQLVLETIVREAAAGDEEARRLVVVETEEPYLLLIDSSGSTRSTGCGYLFRGRRNTDDDESGAISYARTTDANRIRLAKRSVVRNRYYDRSAKTIHPGEVAPNAWEGVPEGYDRPILHSPLALRESFVMSLQNITSGKPTISWKDSKRAMDVGFFWKPGDYSHYSMYRRDIAKVIKTLHHSTLAKKADDSSAADDNDNDDKEPLRRMENLVQISYTDEKGMEAGNVQYKYTLELLSCKIVVIAQRDEWEDHYRLMESLASGALVMTDRMIALPEGLEDGKSIVVYDSPQQLKQLLKKYLKPDHKAERRRIAKKGYEAVMGRHRAWHRLEELLLGRPLTNAYQPNAPAPEKEVSPGWE
mmetsp:Transcript_19150/g.44370  ORF Transcript_19150/g.44370 Transcript_19150/m.44370 type:complete len:617 (-) Transcript_19150:104-1954(-)|eukprot:CAMPEP_0172397396 /NCGR_PEP_ID=MMETSP1061-20121228/30352_1 /TAXON_ID=37318 /ORGANISM="Pseudo-nitzschia pungens, Strain cf. pungens" /LENGTH=616 /DNA_ID=CAMNT_0013129553 /DNA_START=396 /DNA_END=2246 /DNA_ORIENTATION=-